MLIPILMLSLAGSSPQSDTLIIEAESFEQHGGWVVDTPGLRQFELWDIISEEVEGFFVEFRPFVAHCHFPDCSHTHETGCAVKNAAACGLIATERYNSYCRMLDDGM